MSYRVLSLIRSRRSGGGRARALALCALAVCLGGFVYVNALHNPFAYDDYRTVVNNSSIQTLSRPQAILLYEITRPLTNLTYALDRAMWGASSLGFHVTNVLLHMANVALLFLLAWKLVEDRQASGNTARPPISSPATVAFCAAALFAVHPMMTEAVGYISARPDVLSGTLFLIAFLAGRRFLRGGSIAWWIATVALWVAALLAKETAVVLPAVLWCYDRIVLARPLSWRRRVLLHAPLFGLAAAACVIRVAVFATIEHAGRLAVGWRSLAQQPGAVWDYLRLLATPNGQAIFHEAAPVHGLLDFRVVGAAAALCALLVLAWRGRRFAGLASFGAFWFILLLLPSVALAAVNGSDSLAEHRVYLPSCGIFLMVGSFAGWCGARFSRVRRRLAILGSVTFGVVLLSLGGRTMLRNLVWSDPVMLWREAVEQAPNNWFPRSVLGEVLHDANRPDEAVAAFQSALALNPGNETDYFNLAICLAQTGRASDAAATLETLRRREPESPLVPVGLGAIAMITGDLGVARADFLQVLEKDPRNILALQSLAILDEREKRFEDAVRRCEEIQRLSPESSAVEDCIRRNRERLAGGRP